MVKIQFLSQKNFNKYSLDNYTRRQEVKRVYRKKGDEYVLVDLPYIEDWSLEEKRQVALIISNAEHITYIALDGVNIVGFIGLKKELYDEYMVLDYMHVSSEYRGQGIGRTLFNLGKEEAKKSGAKAVYISACPSEETVAFYKSIGSELTDNPIKELAEKEPYDLQMVCLI
ncbi:MAG: GNAT family N-acetyltransferase [Candidatus Coproplasma sp.]